MVRPASLCNGGLLLGVLIALGPRNVEADGAEAGAANASLCAHEPNALSRSACTLGTALSNVASNAWLVAAVAAGGDQVALPPATTERLLQLVAARLGPRAQVSSSALTLAEARRATGSTRGLIYLSVSLYRDRLDVSADAYLSAGHFWQRLRAPGLHLAAHTFSTSPLDPELRALFPPVPLVVTRIDKATIGQQNIMALACGDVRGDGSTEIAAVGRSRIQVGRLEHGRFAERAGIEWADQSPIAESPLQEPIGACALLSPGRLTVGLSDRADSLEISGALTVERKWHGLMPWPGGGCTHREGLGYAGSVQGCSRAPGASVADFKAVIDSFASRSLADRNGRLHMLRVARPLGAESARAIDSVQAEVSIPSVGSALALGDLDADGLAEIVSSSPELARKDDQLLVRTLNDAGQLRERLRLPVPTGIDALAVCPGDGRAMAPLVLSTGDEIWVIR